MDEPATPDKALAYRQPRWPEPSSAVRSPSYLVHPCEPRSAHTLGRSESQNVRSKSPNWLGARFSARRGAPSPLRRPKSVHDARDDVVGAVVRVNPIAADIR